MKGGIGSGNCSRTRRISCLRPAVVVVALLVVALAAGLAGWSGRSPDPRSRCNVNYPRVAINQALGGAVSTMPSSGRPLIDNIVTRPTWRARAAPSRPSATSPPGSTRTTT
jgi:hypothetical protein